MVTRQALNLETLGSTPSPLAITGSTKGRSLLSESKNFGSIPNPVALG